MADDRDALNARRRELYAERLADPYLKRRLRQLQALQRAKMNADPKKLARRRATRRAYYYRVQKKRRAEAAQQQTTEERRSLYVAMRERQGLPVAPKRRKNDRLFVPAEPARAWLQAYADWTGLVDAAAIAEQLGLVGRRVQAVLYGQQPNVWLEQIDRAIAACATFLTVDGKTVYEVADLYPEAFA